MRKNIIYCLLLTSSLGYAQVGVNTDSPRATLDVVKNQKLSVNGIIFPSLTTEERNSMENVTEGTTIFNTSTKCLEYWNSSSWICTNGGSTSAPEPEPPTTTFQLTLTDIDGLSDELNAFFVSVYDDDYLPFKEQTDVASIDVSNMDGTSEKLIDFQGGLGTDALGGVSKTILLKYNCVNGPCNWEAYNSTITIDSKYLENGSGNQITFSIPAKNNVATGTDIIEGTLTASTPIMFKKLDLNKGLGADKKGLNVANFTVRLSSSPTIPLKIRVMPAVVDAANKLAYIPINAENTSISKVAFNLDLGAEYADMTSPYFNPAKTTQKTAKDFKAFGHMFQWQRKADGHQKIKWTSASSFTRVNTPVSSTLSSDWTNAGVNTFITNNNSNASTNNKNLRSWVIPTVNESDPRDLWTENGANNPCPGSFHIPTKNEKENLLMDNKINGTLQLSGFSMETNGNIAGSGVGFYWTSTSTDGVGAATDSELYKGRTSDFYNTNYTTGAGFSGGGVRARGMSIRCVSDR
ncbi:hypothetical protein [Riemerella columbina]|uniref:hypothetical protein n=1 Tax=Riemerella columbina TaxID=103810 RepID=UPI0003628002|nr:hypothetical protein [Riemerella columbina]